MREMLRPAVFIPESKRLNVLLKEFRANRNHIAIVVDEYGGVAGPGHDRGRASSRSSATSRTSTTSTRPRTTSSPDKQRPLPRQGADRDRGFQRRVRHALQRRGLRHHRRPGAVERFGRLPKRGEQIAHRRTAASRCCAPTAARCTCCWWKSPRQPNEPAWSQPRDAVRRCACSRLRRWALLLSRGAGSASLGLRALLLLSAADPDARLLACAGRAARPPAPARASSDSASAWAISSPACPGST